MSSLLVRYAAKLVGVLSCFDRIIITGTIPGWCYPEGMTAYLAAQGIRVFDYARQFAEPLREEIRANAERLATEHGLTIEFIRKARAFRKEERIKAILAERGEHPGLVHIFSAMESSGAYVPWHDKATGHTGLRRKDGKCLHYYFYFIDAAFGLCYLRVPTWAPFRLQFYCNGHSWLARQLTREGIAYTPLDNTFVQIADLARAQALADAFPVEQLHRMLDAAARRYCPPIRRVPDTYHWSLLQVEYATDLIFRRREDLRHLYDTLIRMAVQAVKVDHIAMFLGKKLDGRTAADLGTDFATRSYGTRLKHYLGWIALKLYDKFGIVLRIETTVNDVRQLKHYRTVEHRDGTSETKYAAMQKTIYSLGALRELLLAANQRYLAFLSDLDDPSDGQRHLTQLGPSRTRDGRAYRGFNLFQERDLQAVLALLDGAGCLSGLTNAMLRRALPDRTSAQISYLLKRCRVFGLLKKCGKRYTYYLTKFGRRVLLAARAVQEFILVPTLAGQQCA